VGVRRDDTESELVVREFASLLSAQHVEALGVGVVGSMNSCLAVAEGDFIALLDDDVEIPPEWTATMLKHLEREEGCVAVGGRDILLDYPEMRRSESLVDDVGLIHCYGRLTGNHHRAGGKPRCVDALRGSNILFRGEFLRRAGFELGLKGAGAQVNWELALALQARSQGRHMFFDPSIHVLHHVAPRHDDDLVHRGVFSVQGTKDIAYNETFVLLRHGSGWIRVTMLAWQLAVGSPTCPRRTSLLKRLKATMQGRAAAAIACAKSQEL
jgi:GT2 family glycosyltransferase